MSTIRPSLLWKSKQEDYAVNLSAQKVGAHTLTNSIRSLHSSAAKKVAEGIKGAREAVRPEVSQRDLAARLKWPHSVIGMIESRQRHVRVVELIEIAKALGVSPEEVLRRCLR